MYRDGMLRGSEVYIYNYNKMTTEKPKQQLIFAFFLVCVS